MLGNGILHLTLLILSAAVEVPKQEEMDELISSDVNAGEYSCVSSDELLSAVNYAWYIHLIAFCVLVYV